MRTERGLLRPAGALLLLLAFLLLPLSVGADAVSSQPSAAPVSAWYADGRFLTSLDAKTGEATESVGLPAEPSALGADPVDGSVVVLTEDGMLRGYDASREQTFESRTELGVASAESGAAVSLAQSADGEVVWLAGGDEVLRLGPRGGVRGATGLEGDEAKAIAPAQDGTVWILGSRKLNHLSETGEILSERDVPEAAGSARWLALDELGGRVYVAGDEAVVGLDVSGEEESPREIRPQGGVEGGVAVDPSDGTLFVGSRASLLSYDADGRQVGAANLEPRDLGRIVGVSYDATGSKLWVGGEKGFVGVSPAGEVGTKTGAADLAFFSAAPPSFSSRLSLAEPTEGTATNDPNQPVKLKVEALCNGEPCPEGSRYAAGLKLEATLNGQKVGDLFALEEGATAGTATYVPEEGLPEGENEISAELVDAFGSRSAKVESSFSVDTTAPRFSGVAPEDGATVEDDKIVVSGKVDDEDARVYVEGLEKLGGKVLSDDPKGFRFEVPLEDGENSLRLLAYDGSDNMGEEALRVTREAPLSIDVASPRPGSTVGEPEVAVEGTMEGPEGTEVRVGEIRAEVDDGAFSAEGVALEEGENAVVVTATTPDGRSAQETLELAYEEPEETALEETRPQGTEEDPQDEPAEETNTEEAPQERPAEEKEGEEPPEDGPAEETDAEEPPKEEPAQEQDGAEETDADRGSSDGAEPTVRQEEAPDQPEVSAPGELPEDPEEVAPRIDASTATDLAASTEFLYEGPDAAQTGVKDGAIDPERAAVLRGEIKGPEGKPLPGVKVTVLDHPEYGETLTREDGGFDLAVNGGGEATLVYEKDGYMPAQRQVAEVPWRDYAVVDEAAMVPFSRRVTDVDLAETDEMVVAQGEAVADEDGKRHSTTLFPKDVEAEMVMSDGEKKPLPAIDFRATEYTVGEDGPERMPAELPPSSGYTYAVELSVDEAVEAGAETVEFSEPVYNYVENFLGFPAGTDVPSGYYDKEEGAWKASEDGRVVEILGEEGGLAVLDLDGKGEPADAETLKKFGVTDEESRKLAELYDAGQSLWRVPVDHFSIWDYNYPWGSPAGATVPNQPPVVPEGENQPKPECRSGSIIECQNQVLGEKVGVSGTPFSLRYGSDRVPGRTASNILKIPLSGATVPAPLKRIDLQVTVAGQVLKKSFPAQPDQRHVYEWDGKDAYGRALVGERGYKVRVGYVYDAVYMDPALVSASFASLSGSPLDGDISTREFVSWQDSQGTLTAPQDARKTQGMGGWGLDVLHRYDPESRTLMLGTGEERVGAKDVDNVVKAAAGGGAQVFFGGDGGPAADAQMNQPRSVAVGPDGSFYVADTANQRIRKVGSDGTIATVAGNGGYASYWAPSDDGKPAKDVPLSNPEHFVVAPDGSIYYTDASKPRVRKIGPDGIVKTVAGNGTSGFTGDGGPATAAQLQSPSGIALAPDGSLFIRENYRVRKVAPDGNISTVAGNGVGGFAGDGGPAAQAQIGWGTSLAVDRDGNLYVSDPGYYRVRKVATDGNISTVAGNGSYPYYYQSSGDGGAATQARVYPQNIAVAPDGSLYINDSNARVRRVGVDGNISTVAGGGANTGTYDDGVPATKAYLNGFGGLSVASDGSFYIADVQNNSVRRVNAEGIIDTVAGSLNAGDGAAARAYLSNPDGVAAAPDGSFFIADAENNRIRKLASDGTVSTVAGTGRRGSSGDGGTATKAKLNKPSSVTVAADGTVYFADTGNHRVRRVDPAGLLTTVAGDGTPGFAGDGGPAAQARLSSPSGVTLDSTGVLYVSDTNNNRIRRIGIDGIVTTVGGKDAGATPGIGGPAVDAKLNQPRSVAAGSDGAVYFADSTGSRVFKIGPDGVLSVAAGTGTSGYYGDTGPAAQAQLSGVAGLATGPDGSLYINDSGNGRIRRVESDGTILSVAGGGASSWNDNVAGTDARISGRGIAVAPDGGLYVADQNRIRKVGSFLTGNSPGNLTIPSEDGSELYVFTSRGQHLRTLDSVTGKALHEFSYDEGKRLVGVKDVDGLTTKVERDASGNPTALVAPNGERTALSTDADGYLTSISNPAGESINLSYGRGGLLASFSRPKGNTSRFTYDETGRLTKDEDAAGGFKALSKRSTAKGTAVDLTTAEGRKTTYETEPLAGGQTRRVITGPSGLKTDKTLSSAGDVLKSTTPDGTVVQSSMSSDPRFGAQSPYQGSVSVKTPSGLTSTTSANRSATLKDPGNPLSATTVTGSTSVNWRTYSSTFDTATKKVTSRTPAGRQSVSSVDDRGRVVTEEFGGLAATSYEYDGRGRMTKAATGTGANARTTTYEYDLKDRVSSVTDPAGRVTRFEYDGAGRVTRQVLPDLREILYSYDANGNLASLTPPGRPGHDFAYNNRDEARAYTPPGTGAMGFFEDRATAYEYDLDGLVTAVNRPGGERTSVSRDAGGRPTRVTAGSGADAPSTTYAYDLQTGNVASATAPGGKLSYAYDGFLTTSETLQGEVSGKVSYKYNNNFQTSSVAVNAEVPIPYYYDSDGLVVGAGALSVTRDPKHGAVTATRLNNVADGSTYDAFGELASYKATFQGAYNAPEEWFSASYKRDSVGRIVERSETVGDVASAHAYAYDVAGRLVEVKKDGQKVASYSYDANGNRTSETTARGGTVEAAYDAQDRLIKRGQTSYEYAPSGDLRSKTEGGQTTTYGYDAFGNLTSATLPGGKKVEYVVDGRDRRVGKKVDGKLVRGFLYAGQLSPVAELDATGKVVSRFVHGAKGNVPEYMVRDGKTYRLISDHLGSVRLVANAQSGEIVQRIDYDEFGNVLADSNPGFQPFGFAGGLYDQDTKLTRFGARDYDAEAGRWTAKDPIRFAGGDSNIYGYVFADPVNLIDPSGLATGGVCLSGNAGIGAGGQGRVCAVTDFRIWDPMDSFAITASAGAGLHSPDLSGGVSLQATSADNIQQLKDDSFAIYEGVSAGPVIVDGGYDFSQSFNSNGDYMFQGHEISAQGSSPLPPTPFETHAGYERDIFELTPRDMWNSFKCGMESQLERGGGNQL